jgi:hypothetical protein
MVKRREMCGGVLGAMLGVATPHPGSAAAAAADDSCDVSPVVSAVDRLRDEFRRQAQFWELEPIRRHQKAFLRSFNKYPDVIEVGTDIWHDVYDWHVRYNQPMTISRDAQGHMTILLMTTTVVIRTELGATYVGPPYDKQ